MFDYTRTHTTRVVPAMFKGFSGYIQADACCVYNALFRPAKPGDPEDDGRTRSEVGCWSHCRRKFWEAAFAKAPLAREILLRLSKIFEVDAQVCRKNKPPPAEIRRRRNTHLKPLLDEFFAFVEPECRRIAWRCGSAKPSAATGP